MKRIRARFTHRSGASIYEADHIEIKKGSGGDRSTFRGNVTVNGEYVGERWDRQGHPVVQIEV